MLAVEAVALVARLVGMEAISTRHTQHIRRTCTSCSTGLCWRSTRYGSRLKKSRAARVEVGAHLEAQVVEAAGWAVALAGAAGVMAAVVTAWAAVGRVEAGRVTAAVEKEMAGAVTAEEAAVTVMAMWV
eukprot:4994409-Prymnesium_polylepis.1